MLTRVESENQWSKRVFIYPETVMIADRVAVANVEEQFEQLL